MNTVATLAHTAAFEATSWMARVVSDLSRWPAAPERVGKLQGSGAARIQKPQGVRITCLTGALWLTFDGEPEDTVLEAGQSMVCRHSSPLLISAFGKATWRAQ